MKNGIKVIAFDADDTRHSRPPEIMKKEIDIDTWYRKDHYRFFTRFEEPFFGVSIRVDCTRAYAYARETKQSFFLLYLYRALKAANSIEAFRYRIFDGKVFLHDVIHASPTINRPDGSFGFAYMDYEADEALFMERAQQVTEEVRNSSGLVPSVAGQNVIHFSALPWLDFTALSHARSFSFPDSCPKISFGKMTEDQGVRSMPVSIHGHHGLMDGYHVGLFAERFAELMNE